MLRYSRYFLSQLRPITRGFPYKFNQHPVPEETGNDLDNEQQENKQIQGELSKYYHRTVEDLFGKELFQGFSFGYRNLLEAFRDKDNAYLQSIFEPLLFNSTKIPEVQLISPDSPIECSVTDLELVFGVPFDRCSTPNYKNLQCLKTEYNDIECLWYSDKTWLPNPNMLPIIRIAVEFKTKSQLLLLNQLPNDRITHHIVHFDMVGRSGKLEQPEWTPLTVQIFTKRKNALEKLVKRISTGGYDWLISDIDGFLEGNLWHKQPLA